MYLSYREYIKQQDLEDCGKSWIRWKVSLGMTLKEATKAANDPEWGYKERINEKHVLISEKEKEELDAYKKAEADGYITRCVCGSLNIITYTDEDFFTSMTRCKCTDCGKNFSHD